MILALLLGLSLAVRRPDGEVSPVFPYLLPAFGFFVGIPIFHAINDPIPKNVQAAVKRCILGLIALDAILATAYVGLWGLLILLLWAPALYLGRRVYST
jgi:4-hydroxybenzoate polyprenyltransferase